MSQARYITAALPGKVLPLLWSSQRFSKVILGVSCPTLTAPHTGVLKPLSSFKTSKETVPDTFRLVKEPCHDLGASWVLRKWSVGRSDVTATVRITSLMGGGSWGLRTVIQQCRLGQICLLTYLPFPCFIPQGFREGKLFTTARNWQAASMMYESCFISPEEIWDFETMTRLYIFYFWFVVFWSPNYCFLSTQ